MSIAGGLSVATERAHALGCRTMQIFSKSPRGWAARPLDPEDARRARELRIERDIGPVAVHASYLLNLASADPMLHERSIAGVADELERCRIIGAEYLVLHVGCTRPEQQDGMERVSRALKRVLDRPPTQAADGTMILLENTAGERGELGSTFEELAEMLDRVGSDRLGVCLDTCHTLAAGYEYRTAAGFGALVATIERTIGVRSIRFMHVNDSKKELGSRVDRHEHIGRGAVGADGFRQWLSEPRFRQTPMVLETPKESDADDRRNLAAIRRLAQPVPRLTRATPRAAAATTRGSVPVDRRRSRP
ncbi:MAG TPA: deoxyribonuclease IV [Nitrospirales bacterium]|nr:deoxyribonuclease IV [Nitrospirales bacterium]